MYCKPKSKGGLGIRYLRLVRDGWSINFWKDFWLGVIPLRIRFQGLFQVSIQKEAKVIDMIMREREREREREIWLGLRS